jgi:16S rRNA processing protein RimM
MSASRLVPIGVVRRAHGLAGEVRVQPHNEESDLFLELDEVVVRRIGQADRVVRIRSSRAAPGAFLVGFEGVTDRAGAEAMRGLEVLVPRDRLPEPAPGEFYHVDLVGLDVYGPSGDRVGVVTRVEPGAVYDVLVVTGPAGERLVPIVDVAVARIDLGTKRIDLTAWDDP